MGASGRGAGREATGHGPRFDPSPDPNLDPNPEPSLIPIPSPSPNPSPNPSPDPSANPSRDPNQVIHPLSVALAVPPSSAPAPPAPPHRLCHFIGVRFGPAAAKHGSVDLRPVAEEWVSQMCAWEEFGALCHPNPDSTPTPTPAPTPAPTPSPYPNPNPNPNPNQARSAPRRSCTCATRGRTSYPPSCLPAS